MSSYAQIYMYYAHFATPTCRQAAMQTYRVCKCAEDWKQQRSSASVKRQQQRSTTSLLSLISRIASMLQRSAIKLQTQYIRGLPTSGRAKMGVTTHCSYIHVRTKSIYSGTCIIRTPADWAKVYMS